MLKLSYTILLSVETSVIKDRAMMMADALHSDVLSLASASTYLSVSRKHNDSLYL